MPVDVTGKVEHGDFSQSKRQEEADLGRASPRWPSCNQAEQTWGCICSEYLSLLSPVPALGPALDSAGLRPMLGSGPPPNMEGESSLEQSSFFLLLPDSRSQVFISCPVPTLGEALAAHRPERHNLSSNDEMRCRKRYIRSRGRMQLKNQSEASRPGQSGDYVNPPNCHPDLLLGVCLFNPLLPGVPL